MMGEDLAGTALGFALFPLVIVIPGYVVGWSTDALDFRQGSMAYRLALSLAFSVCVCPIATYLLARAGSFVPVWTVYGAACMGFLAIARGDVIAMLRRPWVVPLALLWMIVAYGGMMDVATDGGLAMPTLLADYAKHVSVTDAVTRTGVPPANPALYPGAPITLFYYYLWFLLCSLVDQLGGAVVGPRQAVYAGTLWGGFAFAAVYLVYARRFAAALGQRPAHGIALLLLLVTGLDLLPNVGFGILAATSGLGPGIQPDLEWWNEQVSGWLVALLWVPHHVAALVACLTGFLLVLPATKSRRQAVLAAFAFASAAGMSVWVTLTAAAGYAAWMGVRFISGRRAEVLLLAGVGTLALVLASPFLVDILLANRMDGVPVAFSVREFWPLTRSMEWYGVDLGCGEVCKLALLPLNYGLELGYFALVIPLYWRWRARRGGLGTEETLILVLATSSVVVSTFVGAAIHNNDLAWRGFMFAQIALLLWAVPVTRTLFAGGMGRPVSALMTAFLVIGLLGTAAGYARARIWPLDGQRLVLRETYSWVRRNTPGHWIVQHNPAIDGEFLHPLYLHRQVAVADRHFGWLYGVDQTLFHAVYDPVAALFERNASVADVVATCERFSIDLLVAKAADPAWQNRGGWVWTGRPVFATPTTRVIEVSELRALAP
jgi:hypothetical protein